MTVGPMVINSITLGFQICASFNNKLYGHPTSKDLILSGSEILTTGH